MSGGIDLSRFREKFVQEARERLSRMGEAMAFLEGSPGDSRVEGDVLREAHTLKGAARMMGFRKVSALAHEFEEAVSHRRERKVPATPALSEALFHALRVLGDLVSSLAAGAGEEEGGAEAEGAVERLLSARAAVAPPPPAAPPPLSSPGGGSAPPAPVPSAVPIPLPGGDTPSFLSRGDAGRGEVRVEQGRLDAISNLITNAAGTHLRRLEVMEALGGTERRHHRLAGGLLALLEEGLSRGHLDSSFASRVERFLGEERRALREAAETASALRLKEDELAATLGQLLDDLRSEFLSVRMVPLAPIFEMFRQSVAELSRTLGKEVEFVVRGGKTEIDRKVAEAITEPLIHLVRNAVDHGIEAAEVRAARKKPLRGRLVVSATPKKGRVVIEVEDDGKGIDLQEVRDTAVRRGLVPEKAAFRLDDREILSFIFRTGFSTARTMTDISGRGIGMDVVRTVAERFNGSVDIQAPPGQGTKVTLELPLSMAVSRVLLFQVEGQSFGIPVMHAEAVHSVPAAQLSAVEGRSTLLLDGAPVPLVWLSSLLDLGCPVLPPPEGRLLVLVVRHSQRRVAFVVDGVTGEAEAVVRDLGRYLGKVQLFMGSTILGTGEVALLLDVYDLLAAVRMRGDTAPRGDGGGAPANAGGESPSVLVVDEAILSRDVKARLLEAGGFEVETAPGGHVALALLARRSFDAVVAPARMKGMEGADLAGKVRSARPGTAVILVAAPDDPPDGGLAASAGAFTVGSHEFTLERVAALLGRSRDGGGRP